MRDTRRLGRAVARQIRVFHDPVMATGDGTPPATSRSLRRSASCSTGTSPNTRRGEWAALRHTAGSVGQLQADRGQPVTHNAYGTVWRKAREKALTPARQRSPLARRPYDLRHAAVSLWLKAGVPATQVAEWAGHSVHVLMRVYAKCVYGQDEAARRRVEAALAATDARVGEQQIKAA